MKTYMFTVYMIGTGRTPEEAWRDAAENFDVKYMPEGDDIRELEETEED